ncbi:MAG: hypothetical protein HZC11_01470 [Nitrospirae bacterium]|nr:hypothetical protein [Nitrospirota bacterium]
MKRTYSAIFLVSCSALMLEVSLTRLFSIYLWYHFAFMVISIAMLGIGSAGTLLSVFPRLKKTFSTSVCAISAGLSIILGYIVLNHIPFDPVKLSWDRLQIFYIAIYCIVLSIPFFFSGILISSAFSMHSEKSGLIYAADLLGAGIGSLTVLCVLNISGPEYAVLTASTLCFIGALIAGRIRIKTLSVVFIAVSLFLIAAHPDFINIRISPYKALSLSLKYPGAEHLKTYYNSFSRIDTVKSPAIRFAPGLSLKYFNPLPEQIGLSIDGSEMNAVTKADDRNALTFLEFLPSALAYEIKGKPFTSLPFTTMMKNVIARSPGNRDDKAILKSWITSPLARNDRVDRVLILDPKGGLQALIAEHYGAKQIHKLESNPLIVKVINDDLGEFSGRIFKRDTQAGLGRNRLRSSQLTPASLREAGRAVDSLQLYDIIDISLTGTSVTGAFGIAEDYRFTVEAFREYLSALKKDGFLNISLYLIPPPRTELRFLTTVVASFEDAGITDSASHIAAIRSWDSLSILAKKSPLTPDDIGKIKKFSNDRRFDLVYYPEIDEKETNIFIKTPENEYFKAFKNILNPAARQSFIKNYIFAVEPVHDENPFFHYYLKPENIKVIYEVVGQKWQYFIEEGYLLPMIFIVVLILSLIMIVVPVIFQQKLLKSRSLKLFQGNGQADKAKCRAEFISASPGFPNVLLYFAMLGIGFMFTEVTLIQKTLLLLENPSYTVATVLTSILISSGAGSLLSSKFSKLKAPYILFVLGSLILIYSASFPLLLNSAAPYPLKFKMPVVFIFLMPLGFFMGIPFPTGIKTLGQFDETFILWAWAINGCFSVLAPMLAIMIAMLTGFKIVLWLGAAAYFAAFISLRKMLAMI